MRVMQHTRGPCRVCVGETCQPLCTRMNSPELQIKRHSYHLTLQNSNSLSHLSPNPQGRFTKYLGLNIIVIIRFSIKYYGINRHSGFMLVKILSTSYLLLSCPCSANAFCLSQSATSAATESSLVTLLLPQMGKLINIITEYFFFCLVTSKWPAELHFLYSIVPFWGNSQFRDAVRNE